MKKWFVILMNFILGGVVILTWYLENDRVPSHETSIQNWIMLLLLVLCWGTPLVLFGARRKKDGIRRRLNH
ncbi:MAG: hypothetical protein ABIU63_08605 [Chitinophagaceae bacterium]